MNAIAAIAKRMEERETLVCPGIDPNVDRFPDEIRLADIGINEKVRIFLASYIEIVADEACAFKAQKAYFDVLPDGHQRLHEAIRHAQSLDVPVIVDCKIGDITETMRAYCRNVFDILGADGVVVNPYMGDDVMLPFADSEEKMIVPLVKTSNPGSAIVQDIKTERGTYLWQDILQMVIDRWNGGRNMAPVIAATQNVDLASVRAVIPDDMPIFFAGVGAQGGSIHNIRELLNSKGHGVLVNSSRGLMYPEKQAGEHWKDAIRRSVHTLKDNLNASRK